MPVAKAPAGPSAFVRCDVLPNKAATLGTVARLVAITAVIGGSMYSLTLEGIDGVVREITRQKHGFSSLSAYQ